MPPSPGALVMVGPTRRTMDTKLTNGCGDAPEDNEQKSRLRSSPARGVIKEPGTGRAAVSSPRATESTGVLPPLVTATGAHSSHAVIEGPRLRRTNHAAPSGPAPFPARQVARVNSSPSKARPSGTPKKSGLVSGAAADAARKLGESNGSCATAATGAAARPVRHVSRAAVSLAFLQRFVEQHGIRRRGLTTSQLVTEMVKTATASTRCRYTDIMLRNPALKGAVSQGRPFFFVSHAWSRKFTDTLDMLVRHFAPEQQRVWRRAADGQPLPLLDAEDVFVWLDLFAINQHQAPSGQNESSDLAALWEAVTDAQATLMVLDSEGTLLTRIWCLYEAWQSSRAGGGKLRLLSYNISWEPLEKVFINLDVSKAKATMKADRDRILGEIRRDVGSLDAMTHTLKDALVAGAVAQVPSEGTEWSLSVNAKVYTAARLCKAYGRLQQAEELFRRALDGNQAAFGPSHPETLAALGNVAGILEAQGGYDQAEPLFRRALSGQEQVLGPDHPETLTSVSNLAELLQVQGKYDDAEPLYRRALEGRERVLGPRHPDTLVSLNNLAALYDSQGKYDEAEPLYRRALEEKTRVLGTSHPGTLLSVNNLAYLLQLQGRYDEAAPLYRQALQGFERVLGPAHPDTLLSMNNLAALLDSQGVYEEAEQLYRRALEGRERVLGASHPDTLTSLNNLAYLLDSQGKREEAEPLYRRALEGREQVLGPDHPDTLASVNNLGDLLKSQGKYEQAEPLYERALAGLEHALGASHPDTLTSVNNLAGLRRCQDRVAEAAELYHRALEGRERALGDSHPDTLASVGNLASLYQSQGKLGEAEQLYRRALQGSERVLGPDRPQTLVSVNNLATLLESSGKLKEAEAHYRRALNGFQSVLGPTHPYTLASASHLAGLLESQGRKAEAEALTKK